MKKILIFLLTVVFALIFSVCCFCEDKLPEGYGNMIDSLPDEVRNRLPDEMYTENTEDLAEGLMELTSSEYVFELLGECFNNGFGEAVKLFAVLCGILVVSSVFTVLKDSLGNKSTSRVVGMVNLCLVFGVVLKVQYYHIELVEDYFSRLSSLVAASVPITASVYAMGGNITTAGVSTSGTYFFLGVCQMICAKTIIPVSAVCTAFSFSRVMCGGVNLQSLSSAIRRGYTFCIGLIMSLTLFTLSAQTALSSAGDSAALRAAKLVSSSVIPTVGGSVGETFRTVAAGVGYVKSVVGVGAVVFVFLLILPTLITLILNRFVFILSESVAGMLGCAEEGRLLSDMGNISGCMLSVCAMAGVMFILMLVLFIKTTVAIM